MAFEREQQAALRILQGIEEGTLSGAESLNLVDEADPALIYLIFTWLRKRYRNHPAGEGVIGRLVELSQHGTVPPKIEQGKADPIAEWFEDSHSYRDLDAEQFVELIVEKLEG